MGDRSIARTFLFTMGVLGGSLALLGCPQEPEASQAPPGVVSPAATAPASGQARPAPAGEETRVTQATPPAEAPIPAAPAPAAPAPAPSPSVLKDVLFDFDDALVRGDRKPALNDDIAWLRLHRQVKVTIEGYCDERGTEEYNPALGQRRAQAVRDYLVAAGSSADRIATISYGKERPFGLGHDENAWRMNRRDHLVASGGNDTRPVSSAGSAGAQAATR